MAMRLRLIVLMAAMAAAKMAVLAPPATAQGQPGVELTLGQQHAMTGDQEQVAVGLRANETAPNPWTSVPVTTRKAFSQSFLVVGVAELFDKTWFVAVLCSLSYGVRLAFMGSFVALALHSIIAALLGAFISRFFVISLLHFMTAAVFAVLATLYAWEWLQADPTEDAIAGRSEEAREALPLNEEEKSEATAMWWRNLSHCFVAVFVAEWGDRTQIAMISLHASLPVVPVCLGSTMAFFVLSMSAVAVASLLKGRSISERLVLGVSAMSFFIFALLALLDGMKARAHEQAALLH